MRSLRKSSTEITVGTRPLDDLHVRQAEAPGSRALASEGRDWLLVKSLLQPGERARARVAVRFPHEGNAAGHAFLTDLRIMFEFHEKVSSIGLGFLSFVGRPQGPSLGDFVVEAVAPTTHGGGRYTTTMRIRDTAAFHDFFPTLLDAARTAGAQPAVDAGWGDRPTEDAAAPAPDPAPPAPADLPPDEVIAKALSSFLNPGEGIVAAADMVQNLSGAATKVVVTGSRLVVVEDNLIWAAPLTETQVVDGGAARTHLRLLAGAIDATMVLGAGTSAPRRASQRRLVLRAKHDTATCERLHDHLIEHAGGVLDAWPD